MLKSDKIIGKRFIIKELLYNWADFIADGALRYFKLKPPLNIIPKGSKTTHKAGIVEL